MGWHLIQNKENYMKKKDLILAGAVLLLAGILALALRLPKTENGNTMKVTVDGEVYGTYSLAENQTVKIQTGHGTKTEVSIWKKLTARTATAKDRVRFPG